MNDYIRSSNIGQKFVIYDAERDKYIKLALINDGAILEILYVENVQDATFCNSMDEVVKDLEQAAIAITDKIKIIGISIELTITPDFITDYSHKIKPVEDINFEPVPESSKIEKLKKQIVDAQQDMMRQRAEQLRQTLHERKKENMDKEYNPHDISTNEFL